jgi:hypothetical protein
MFAKNSPNWFWHMVDISELERVFSFYETQLNGKMARVLAHRADYCNSAICHDRLVILKIPAVLSAIERRNVNTSI